MKTYSGKYRGTVEDNNDPRKLGRLEVSVPAVLDGRLSWALPCVPYAGPGVGFFFIPPKGANVWIEFEGGDPDYPIWTGCFWLDENDVPVESSDAQERPRFKVIKTDVGAITLNDNDDSLTIETAAGMRIVMNSDGIEINNGHNGTIQFSGQGRKISINGNALEID